MSSLINFLSKELLTGMLRERKAQSKPLIQWFATPLLPFSHSSTVPQTQLLSNKYDFGTSCSSALEKEDHECKASLGYTARSFVKQQTTTHACALTHKTKPRKKALNRFWIPLIILIINYRPKFTSFKQLFQWGPKTTKPHVAYLKSFEQGWWLWISVIRQRGKNQLIM